MTTPLSFPNPDPGRGEPAHVGRPAPFGQPESRAQRRWNRFRKVQIACTVLNVLCGLFAAVLLARIVMVLGDANPANGIAVFVRGWATGVSLGFEDLFTPASAGLWALLNYGIAAIVWLALGFVLTALIRRLALPADSLL
jgi:hypothetical protein